MAHTIRKVNLGNSALVESTITDYVVGGEAYTLAELGITGSVVTVLFLQLATFTPANNIVPRLNGGVIILENRPGFEVPTTTGLNYTFVAIVNGT